MTGIIVTRRDDRLIAVKRSSPDRALRRQREAQLLARLDHPGVVQFVDLVEGDEIELHMDYAGSDSWERQPPDTDAAVVEGLAAVAATVADLHDLGTAHGALVPEHVLVTADRRPVLCGLADAVGADPISCADDLTGLAGLITHLAPATGADLRSRLEGLAARARDGALSARALTDELDALRRAQPAGRSLAAPRPTPVILAAVAVILLAAAAWVATRPPGTTTPAAVTSTAPVTTILTRPSVAAPAAAAPTGTLPATTPPPTTAPAAVLDPASLVVVHDGRRFGLGTQGDLVLLGDWNCDGTLTPALLQPALGQVALFSHWPGEGETLLADATMVIDGAHDLQREVVDGCDRLRVVHPAGSSLFAPELP